MEMALPSLALSSPFSFTFSSIMRLITGPVTCHGMFEGLSGSLNFNSGHFSL